MNASEPCPPLHRLRFDDPGPPRRTTLADGTRAWLLTRYADVYQVLDDTRFRRSPPRGSNAPLPIAPNLANSPDALPRQEGAEHLRLRHLFQRMLNPRAVGHMEPWVVDAIDQVLDELVERGSPADLVDGFTNPLPIMVMSRLLDIPDVNEEQLLRWAAHALADTTRDAAEVADATRELAEFTADIVARRRRTPGEDLVSVVVKAADRDGSVPERQLIALVNLLVVGGHHTTSTMLGNILLFLLAERPQDWARLGADETAAGALAERLLHLIPVGDPQRPRPLYATEDAEICGVTIRSGDIVMADRLTASHDPEAFPAPFSGLFTPLENPTLAFGAGPHYCPGAWLARTELRHGLHRLAARLPGLRLTTPPNATEWRSGSITRSPLHLPATW
ncbi:cytochrome P450 [Streptomyces sp. NPDC059278]|uniref:cytochrome P450 n=1 Tax=Streptomyces sp. NPDC059278 TaxID=3346801 RepID=UPI003679E245